MSTRREFVAGLLAAAAAPALPLLPTRPDLVMNGFRVGDWIEIAMPPEFKLGCIGPRWVVTSIENTGDIILRAIDARL
jgi:hypothetical protein